MPAERSPCPMVESLESRTLLAVNLINVPTEGLPVAGPNEILNVPTGTLPTPGGLNILNVPTGTLPTPGGLNILNVPVAQPQPMTQPPVAVINVDRRSGPTPLTVTFDGRQSFDPDGGTVLLRWFFDDGTPVVQGPVVQHTFTQPGRYSVRLLAYDEAGNRTVRRVLINAGGDLTGLDANRPAPVILAPIAGTLYQGGQRILFSGQATSATGLPISPAFWTWRLVLEEPTGDRIVQAISGQQNGSFIIPRLLDGTPNRNFRVDLLVRQPGGLWGRTSTSLQPQLTQLAISATAPGAELGVGGQPVVAPATTPLVVGMYMRVTAPLLVQDGAQTWEFVRWSDGGARSHPVLMPIGGRTLTAIYRQIFIPPTFF